jgi:hypothetical protein
MAYQPDLSRPQWRRQRAGTRPSAELAAGSRTKDNKPLRNPLRGEPLRRLDDLKFEADTNPSPGEPKRTFWQDVILRREESESAKVRQLYEYWDRLRGDRSMPSRKEIDVTEIWPLVPNLHLSEWHTNPDRIRYRLGGTESVAALGRELKGRWLTDIHIDPKDVEETLALYRRVVATRAPVFGRTLDTSERIGVESFEWVLCPLSDNDRDIMHFIGLEDYTSKRRYLGGMS